MNRLKQLFRRKPHNSLSIYFTAGYPALEDTAAIIRSLTVHGADMIEIGMPFSDPLADGPTIQQSSNKALANGMSVALLLQQLRDIRRDIQVPLVLMGYLNPVLQYGFEAFCSEAAACGIDGLILPDMPLEEYRKTYREIMERFGLSAIFLVCPHTDEDRIRIIDACSDGFIYLVTTSAVTGGQGGFTDEQLRYFERIKTMRLDNPVLAGFGIRNAEDLNGIRPFVNGGIIGSAFIRALEEGHDTEEIIARFMEPFRNESAKEKISAAQNISS